MRALALQSAIGRLARWSQREAVSGPDHGIGREDIGCPDTKGKASILFKAGCWTAS